MYLAHLEQNAFYFKHVIGQQYNNINVMSLLRETALQ